MTQTEAPRGEVIMTGIGGRGVLLIGQILAGAALPIYQHVSWLPSYAAAMRGGPCECTVVFSNDRIRSTVLSQAEALIVVEVSQLVPFLNRVKPGGILVVESAGLQDKVARDDIRVLAVPALQTAVSIGSNRISNLVLLGAYVGASKAIAQELVETELERRFGETSRFGAGAVLSMNREAFRRGVAIGSEFKG